jgi:hypothetical protein
MLIISIDTQRIHVWNPQKFDKAEGTSNYQQQHGFNPVGFMLSTAALDRCPFFVAFLLSVFIFL